MAYKAFVERVECNFQSVFAYVSYWDTGFGQFAGTGIPVEILPASEMTAYTVEEMQGLFQTKILAYSTTQSYGIVASDITWLAENQVSPQVLVTMKSMAQTRSFTNNASHTIQTVAAAANGFQLSTTKDAIVNYAATIVTAATLAAGAVGSIVLEVCSTNSSTAGNWQEIGRLTNGQVFSLALAIGCTQTVAGSIGGIVPAGYYARLRSINTTGTPTYTYNSGQEVLLPTI